MNFCRADAPYGPRALNAYGYDCFFIQAMHRLTACPEYSKHSYGAARRRRFFPLRLPLTAS